VYVCSCKSVTDRTVRAAVLSGAESEADLARVCGAGSRCGGCWPTLRQLIDDTCSVSVQSLSRSA